MRGAGVRVDRDDRVAGAVRGSAYGDAWGYVTEFSDVATLAARFGARGPEFPDPAVVSDDTQMALAVVAALDDPAGLVEGVVAAFDRWLDDPDNDRAPGTTCLTALRSLRGRPVVDWPHTTVATSKGCGTVMRVPWLGLLPWSDPELLQASALQAAVTHGHPTGVVAAVVTAFVARDLAAGAGLADLLARTLTRCEELGRTPDLQFLAGLPERVSGSAPAYWRRGIEETTAAVRRAHDAAAGFATDPWAVDPCELAGQGWIAEEALATALLVTQTFAADPVEGLRRAVVTAGDSDSLATLVGAFAGTALGDVWPVAWFDRLEPRYRAELTAAVARLAR